MPIDTRVTGMTYVRDMGTAADGRRLTMLLSVVADLPVEYVSESQYVISGQPAWLKEFAGTDTGEQLTIHHDGAVDHGERFIGYRADQILTYPIWRV